MHLLQATALCCNDPPLEAPECSSEATHNSQRGDAREDVAQAADDADAADISARGETSSITDENPQRAQDQLIHALQKIVQKLLNLQCSFGEEILGLPLQDVSELFERLQHQSS